MVNICILFTTKANHISSEKKWKHLLAHLPSINKKCLGCVLSIVQLHYLNLWALHFGISCASTYSNCKIVNQSFQLCLSKSGLWSTLHFLGILKCKSVVEFGFWEGPRATGHSLRHGDFGFCGDVFFHIWWRVWGLKPLLRLELPHYDLLSLLTAANIFFSLFLCLTLCEWFVTLG